MAREDMRALQLERLKRQRVRVHRGRPAPSSWPPVLPSATRGCISSRKTIAWLRSSIPKTLEVLPFEDGVEGEIVYAGLEKERAPLVRWRDKDIVQVFTEPAKIGLPGFRVIITLN